MIEALTVARLWGRQRDVVLAKGQRLLRALHQVLSASSFRKRTLMAVAAAIISAALLVLLLEITVRNELAEEASNNSLSVLPMPPASSTEVQPVDLAALMGAPSADDAETLVQSLVASREPVPLPRPRRRFR
jgi:hypothetical protein